MKLDDRDALRLALAALAMHALVPLSMDVSVANPHQLIAATAVSVADALLKELKL